MVEMSNGLENGHINGHLNINKEHNSEKESNGHVNGAVNGKVNGHVNGKLNGHVNDIMSEAEKESKRLERAKEVQALALKFKPSTYTDDIRCENASYYGGFQLLDDATTSKLRGAFTEILKMAGQKILCGEFNLTSIVFPIKCQYH